MFRSTRDFIIKRFDLFFKRQLSDKDILVERLRGLNLEWINNVIR